jgi:hypothetical protein
MSMSRFARLVPAPSAKQTAVPRAAAPQPQRAGPQRGALWHAIQLKAAQSATARAPARPSRSGLPAGLKAGVERLSGIAMDDVRVHRNSGEPAKLGALAYAHGNDIHLGPGQEQHLPHEAWHVVQQKQKRVVATTQMRGAGVNDDALLEREADVMGARAAAAASPGPNDAAPARPARPPGDGAPIQGKLLRYKPVDAPSSKPVAQLDEMATMLNVLTEKGHQQISAELALLSKGLTFDFDKYPNSSELRIAHFYNVLGSTSDSLKRAAAGYMIEDIVTKGVHGEKGFQSQYVMSGARPDFVIESQGARGVVDITSIGQRGHIFNKSFSPASFDYVAECIYDPIDFGSGVPKLSDKAMASVREITLESANESYRERMLALQRSVDTYTSFHEGPEISKAAIALLKNLKALKNVSSPADYAQVDLDIAALDTMIGRTRKDGVGVGLPTVARILKAVRDKYALQGFPPTWTAPPQVQQVQPAPAVTTGNSMSTTQMLFLILFVAILVRLFMNAAAKKLT